MRRPLTSPLPAAFGLMAVAVFSAAQPPSAADSAARRNTDRSAQTNGGDRGLVRLEEPARITLIDQVVLAGDTPGVLAEVKFHEGDSVPARTNVARLHDDVARAALATAEEVAQDEIEIEYAKAAHEVASIKLEKARAANRDTPGAVPQLEIEELKLDAERSRLQIKKAGKDKEIAGLRRDEAAAALKGYAVNAPEFDGVVVRVYKHAGEAVRQGDPIMEIVSTRRLRAEGMVNVRDAWKIKPGHLVHLQLYVPEEGGTFADRTFEGRVTFVDKSVDPVNRKVRVWAEVDNADDALKGGLQAWMTIDTSRTVDSKKTAQK
ncbi:MAG: HlyD family efflux transporter periplasmic adaptor subunit [Planctomycetes bacterium]|nr:HlyD family efflux transporter periplasmic adaptor subunit [Planctomycetota bacterium]